MPKVTYHNKTYDILAEKSLLESLEQQGAAMPSSCRSGTCQTCKKKVIQGNVPEAAQKGLKPTEQAQGHFLPCVCHPTEDLVIADLDHAEVFDTEVLSVKLLNDEVAEIKLKCPEDFTHQPGQYIQVFKDKTLCRTYSLASLPKLDEPLTLNVKKVADGKVSTWLHGLTANISLKISSPLGNCFYQPSASDRPMLLMGTGSGLAPLYGIIREAIANNHQGGIWLFHGVSIKSHLYYQEQLTELAQKFPQFHYFPCLSDEYDENCEQGLITDIALKKIPSLKNFIVYLSGSPIMVKQASMKTFLAGASMQDIYKDPFG